MKTPNTEKKWPAEDREWKALFAELCHAHRLTWRQKWLLKSISKSLAVKPAVRLFIEPNWFTAAARIKQLQHRRGQLIELSRLLFQRERQKEAETAS